MDAALFRMVNSLAGHWPLLDAAGRFLAQYGLGLVAIGLAAFILRARDRRRALIGLLQIAVAVVVGLSLAYVIGHAVNRPRPFVVMPVRQLLPHDPEPSLPSEHVTFLAAVAGVTLLEDSPLGVGVLVLAVVVGAARVFVGVHYPADIAAGLVLGVGVGFAVRAVTVRLLNRTRRTPV
jgi:undecaprenyl-diphosphatase